MQSTNTYSTRSSARPNWFGPRAAILVALLAAASPCRAQGGGDEIGYFEPEEPTCEALEESERSFGPGCEVRKTLLQWSYGTSFSGGPPGPDERLASDRPDFTEASVTVGRGVAQVEMGYTYLTDRDGDVRHVEHSAPEMLWRIGMFAEWFELRIAYNHLAGFDAIGNGPRDNFSGGEDLYLGVKLGLTPQEGILPESSLILQSTVPTGHGDLTSDLVLPGISWLYGWDINDFYSVGGSTQGNRAADAAGDVYFELAQSLTVNYALTEQVTAYTEWFALIPSGSDTVTTEHYFNGGFAWAMTNDLQFDIRAGVGLNPSAADFFTGAGVVMRF